MKKYYIIIGVIVIIQLIPMTKNQNGPETASIDKKYKVPEEVAVILKDACYDCHSNNTEYPWYTKIQPVGFWLNHHVNEGKEHLNFSEFLSYPATRQSKKLEEVVETIEEGEMPLASYTYFGLHKNAKLSEAQKQVLINWAKSVKSEIVIP
ncbi:MULTISPECIES: heme-binding domain-containing protein [unclassified Paraflavitalea]|uniref:heme-binding domain-containing protein n=1 Tax=unclassified Paraflavitalea TaxID=2798305 RepID=UPI003D335CFA